MKETKKIGLVTVSNHNYGSQLQAFAMHQILFDLGIDNEIIKYKQSPFKQLKRISNLDFFMMKGKSILKNIFCRLLYPEIANGLKERTAAFEKFKHSNYNYSPLITERKHLEGYVYNYRAIVLGSDQVWHPANLGMDYFTLTFVPDSIPKITYASSFGVSDVPSDQIKETKRYLSRIDVISVREKAGVKIIKELVNREVPVVCDPTALLTKEQWDMVRSDKIYCDEKYIFCYFIGRNKNHRDFADDVKKLTGYKILALQHLDEFIKDDIKFGDIKPFDVGPQDFLNIIAKAEIVLTDSFHVTMFSIYYHKKFYTFSRFLDGEKSSTNSRLESVLQILGLETRYLNKMIDPDKCLKWDIDWRIVDNKLATFRDSSIAYLNSSLSKYGVIGEKSSDVSISSKEKRFCTGCTACVYSCPQKCIRMEEDYEGFLYPEIDDIKCIKCGLCRKVCPVTGKLDLSKGKVYAARNSDRNIRLCSSSGGIFNSIATYVLNNNGLVVGAAFDDNLKLKHIAIDNISGLTRLQASKYVQSDLGDIFKIVKQELKKERQVLFCGTPCQSAGLNHYLKRRYDNLILVDVLCYGVPSPGVFRQFICFLEKKRHMKIKDFFFRDKKYGYASPNVKAIYEDGYVEEMTTDVKSYTRAFFSGIITRPACFDCRFKGVARETDITLGDFWEIGNVNSVMDDDTGATLVFAHTEKGIELISDLKGVELTEIAYSEGIYYAGPMLDNSAKPNIYRGCFFEDLKVKDYISCINRYAPDPLKSKMANVIKPIILNTGFIKLGILKSVKKRKIKIESTIYR